MSDPLDLPLSDPLDLPLPQRMRVAAEVLEEANEQIGTNQNSMWSPESLRYSAQIWEAEDAERLGREKQVEELAQAMRTLAGARNWTEIARKLIDEGWTKVTGDE